MSKFYDRNMLNSLFLFQENKQAVLDSKVWGYRHF